MNRVSSHEAISEDLEGLMDDVYTIKKKVVKFQKDHSASLSSAGAFWYSKGAYNMLDSLYRNFQELHLDLWVSQKSEGEGNDGTG